MDLVKSENISPAKIDAEELPEGFTVATGSSANDDSGQKSTQVDEQKKVILEQACTQEALARLGRIRMVREENAKAIANSIVSMALSGKLPGKITESKMIEILERGGSSKPQERQINIQRKRYAFDSSDEESDDGDV